MTILFGNILIGFGQILDAILTFFTFVVIAEVVLSWVNPDPYNPLVRFIKSITEPPIRWIRRKIPTNIGMLDLAPMILILGVILARAVIASTLIEWGMKLKISGAI